LLFWSLPPCRRPNEGRRPTDGRLTVAFTFFPAASHSNAALGTGEFYGFYVLARQYYERYELPLMYTETNLSEKGGAACWLWKQWHSLLRLREDGVPVLGFTWYSLTDQMDWDTALREDAHRVNAVGLYDLDRNGRTAGRHFQRLVRAWGPALAGAHPRRRAA
jgi:hypothetical protein